MPAARYTVLTTTTYVEEREPKAFDPDISNGSTDYNNKKKLAIWDQKQES